MTRRLLPLWIGLTAAAIWLLCGAAFGLVVWFGLLRGDVIRLLVPQTIPPEYWQWGVPASVLAPAGAVLLVGALVAGLVAGARRGRAELGGIPLLAVAWLAMVIAGTVTGLAMGIGTLLGRGAPASLSTVAQGLPDQLAPAIYAGVVVGWIPGLVGWALSRRESSALTPPASSPASHAPRRRLAVGPAVGPVAGVVAAISAVVLIGTVVVTTAHETAAGLAGVAPPSLQQPPPTPVPTGSPPATRAPGDHAIDPRWCTDSQLAFSDLGGDGATGHREETVAVTNTGRDDCILNGYPDLAFADEHGAAVDAAVRDGSGFMTQDAGPAALTLHPGDQAVTMLAWDATDGRTVIPQLLIAPYAGADRVVVMTRGMDITSASEVAVTAWSASAAATG